MIDFAMTHDKKTASAKCNTAVYILKQTVILVLLKTFITSANTDSYFYYISFSLFRTVNEAEKSQIEIFTLSIS